MDKALIQQLRAYIGVVIALPLFGDAAQRYGLLGAVLKAAEALIAVGADGRRAADHMYVALGAYAYALSAADTFSGVYFHSSLALSMASA